MLVVRDAQLATFKAAAVTSFVERVLPILREEHPLEFDALAPEAARALAVHCVMRSEAYGLTTEANVYTYIQVALLLGRDFDDDESLPWAADILGDASIADEDEKASRLVDAVAAHLGERGEP